jgi:hypothetical protein
MESRVPFASRAVLAAAIILVAGCGKGASSDNRAAAEPPLQLNPAVGPQSEAALRDPRARIFLTKGCPQCHAISALQVVSPTSAGPDLTVAATDVRSRFNTSLDSFMQQPTGTMQIVLSSMIQLTPAERDSIVKLLRELNHSNTGTAP